MAVRAYYSVFCNECGDWIGQERTPREARSVAKAAGWSVKRNDELCPDCVKSEAARQSYR